MRALKPPLARGLALIDSAKTDVDVLAEERRMQDLLQHRTGAAPGDAQLYIENLICMHGNAELWFPGRFSFPSMRRRLWRQPGPGG